MHLRQPVFSTQEPCKLDELLVLSGSPIAFMFLRFVEKRLCESIL